MSHIASSVVGKILLRNAFNILVDYHVLFQGGFVELSEEDFVKLTEATEQLASLVILAVDDQLLQELKEEKEEVSPECLKTCFAQQPIS